MVPTLPSLSLSLSLSVSPSLSLHLFLFAVVLGSLEQLAVVHTCGCHVLALLFAGCPFFVLAEVICSTLRLSSVGCRGCPLFLFPIVLCWFSRLSSALACLSPQCLPCASPGPASTYVEPSRVKPGLGPLLVPRGLHQVDSSSPWHLLTPLDGHCGFMMGGSPSAGVL